ncbi:putative LmbE-like protein [Terriglobus roseus DSM 18391]|uniref:Putative LmbE-like protein n=1 Tax=Terriglobus roseus (strain DSM 18391 / NRRL B-41598 / KBS 63) TaxID=926566 RepID=I3ZLG5_TERRK|nr:putative LmbE-like protein [Terriglobus roseus DSM 18391]
MKRTVLQPIYAALAVCAVLAVPAMARPQAQHDAEELHIQQNAFATPLPFDRGAAGLAQSLRKLSTRATLLQINAHPDDEDGASLAYVSRGLGATVSLLSLNRGEGGQNVMTPEFWDGLGILRTQEHLTANHYYGVNLYYTRVADFGFSKTREETLRQWGHERVLGDAVRVVRETRPMVITSVFSGNSSDGHGHHQTAGVTAQEVYNAAGDPKMFPEQIKEGLQPWSPLKVYARSPFARATGKTVYDYATGKTEPLLYRNYITGETMDFVPPATVTVPGGTYNALFGESYAQISREGLNQQKSQNGGVATPPPGRADASYHLYASRVGGSRLPQQEDNFFAGIDTSLPAIASVLPTAAQGSARTQLVAIDAQVREANARFDANDPSKSALALAKGLDLTRALIADLRKAKLPEEARYNAIFELETKERQFNQALAQSLGMSMVATVQAGPSGPQQIGPGGPPQPVISQTVVAGENFGVNIHVADQGLTPVAVDAITLVPSFGGDWKVRTPPPPLAPAPPPPAASATTTGGEAPPVASTAEGRGSRLAAAPTPPPIGPLAAGVATDAFLLATVPADAAPTAPYFSRPSLEQSFYDIKDPRFLTLPTEPYPLSAQVNYTFAGTHATLTGVVQTPHRYNGLGVLQEPLLVAPAISVSVSPASGILPLTNTALPLQITIHSSVKGPASGTLKLELPKGWTSEPASATFKTMRDNEDVVLRFRVTTPGLATQTYPITAVAEYNGKQYTQGFTTIGYPGIRPYPRYAPSTSRITGVDVKVAQALKVGYVMGSGDEVPDSLHEIGVDPVMLSDTDLQRGDLNSYDAIILGVRTYTARPAIRAANSRLLDYVKAGGVVISQYQDATYDHDYAPFPISVPGDQGHTVVEEDAKVTLLHADDPVMTWPNKIVPADFDNWVEERGHGFPKSFGPEWTALTEVHDTGQDPQKGGLLYAQYGKGYYAYLAYAFFREMPEGVPGSFRIMANLLSLGKNPKPSCWTPACANTRQ